MFNSKLSHPSALDIDDRQILFHSRASLNALFAGFDDPCVLVHGNLALSSMLKEAWDLAMINPGRVLWAPRSLTFAHCASPVFERPF
ncbi:hypothetical protein [Candidatus Erwinia dacicola]|uniref:Uncharacterized protein n=1 Tax=Candidatus Erwinia dacicola TaxID=252393 RepID=A0A1E7YWU1_9GAMM|nr:hypothetical protein [Candidatus Erwinia dacicola]OFC60924.1 hypothetical protein BBW68_13930 [Candidatus Erwinia dacicola]RAP72562.1 hypothetical protein ACZ87_00615 [Candidatus Erwinia dacicola]